MIHTKFSGNRSEGFGEEDFWRIFTIYGPGGHLGHVTSIMFIDFHFIVPESLHTIFFLEKQVLIFIFKCPGAKVKKWPWPSKLTYLHKFNKMSASTNFQVTGCNSFWKIHCFHFFLQKSLCYQIWPSRQIGQGQPRVIIWTNYDGLESPMLHTKFRGNRSAGTYATYQVSWKSVHWFQRRFLKGFHHILAWRPSWSCDPDAANKISFPLPKEAPHKIWLWSPQRFLRRCLSIVGRTKDGQTPEHGYTISSPMSLRFRWAKNHCRGKTGMVLTAGYRHILGVKAEIGRTKSSPLSLGWEVQLHMTIWLSRKSWSIRVDSFIKVYII